MQLRVNSISFENILSICIFTLAFVSASMVNAETLGLVTGLKSGTYIKIGNDIAKVAGREGLDIEVKESNGSLGNIERINSKENAAFGIVQSDVLGYLKKDPDAQPYVKRLRVILPLYLEEIHILTRKNIVSLSDLNGKRVSIGPKGSGTWLTANNLFRIMGIHPADDPSDEYRDKPKEMAIQLILGKIDAVFYVAGKPVELFEPLAAMAADNSQPETQKAVSQLHFLSIDPITAPAVFNEYEKSSIGPRDYPWLSTDVPVAAVRAVLVSFDFSSRHNEYFKQRCEQLRKLGKAVRDNLVELQKGKDHPNNFHSKWKEVTFDSNIVVPGWNFDRCSQPDTSGRGVSGSGSGSVNKSPLEDILRERFN